MPWARPGARHTRDFEDVVAWLAQRTDKTTITKLLRCSWESVAAIVVRVVAEAIDDARLESLYRIGVDEIAYRSRHRYITVVADHDRDGAVVWAKEGKDAKTLEAFYDLLGEQRCRALEAVSLDMGVPTPRRLAPRHHRLPSASILFTSSSSPTRPSTSAAAGPGAATVIPPGMPPGSNAHAGHC